MNQAMDIHELRQHNSSCNTVYLIDLIKLYIYCNTEYFGRKNEIQFSGNKMEFDRITCESLNFVVKMVIA